MRALKIGNQYWTIGQNNNPQQISEQDLVARAGAKSGGGFWTVDDLMRTGDIKEIDPSKITLQKPYRYDPNSDAAQNARYAAAQAQHPNEYELWYDNQPLNIAGTQAIVKDQTTAQALGMPQSVSALFKPGGAVQQDQDFQKYLQDTGQTYDPKMGFSGQSWSQNTKPDYGNTGTTQTNGGQGIQGVNGAVQSKNTGQDTAGGGTVSASEMDQKLRALGLDPNTIPDNMKSAFAAISDSFSQQWSQGLTNANIDAGDLQKAIASVANDPEFKAKYGDSLALANANFDQAVQDYQFQSGQTAQQQATQFSEDRKKLAEQEAAAGRAYSGFREQAKQKLATEQQGIVESTRKSLQKGITGLGMGYEAQFGTGAAKTPNVGYVNPLTGTTENITYSPIGGIYGSEPLAKKQEQESLGQQRFYDVKSPQAA